MHPNEITLDGIKYQRVDRIGNRVSCYAMYDAHCFHRLEGSTVDGLIAYWKDKCENHPDKVYGAPDALCPVIVLDGDTELRRVGAMVHGLKDSAGLAKWREACLADPEITRLLGAPSET